MPSSSANPTPQPLRQNDSGAIRYKNESELWDALSCVVYTAAATLLTVTMPVAGRVVIIAEVDLDAAGTLTLSLNFSPYSVRSFAAAESCVIVAAPDLPVGVTTISLDSSATMSNPIIIARRGRLP